MNIINAVFGGNSRYCTTRSVFQIDKGDVLRFVGLNLPEYYEVHFSNNKNALATRVLASGDSVVIPWEFMRHGQKEVFAWVYLTPDAESGYTPYQVTIPLNLRSDVSDVEPTPEQEDIIAQAINALNDGVERAENAADDAEVSAQNATTAEASATASATAALTAKSGAEAARDVAVTAKESAEAAHIAAMQSASEAEGYAGDAETAKNAAEEAAEDAEQAAANAGYMFFSIDDRGHLIYQRTSNTQVDFYLENGHLYVEAIA